MKTEDQDKSFRDVANDVTEQLGYTKAINDVYRLMCDRLNHDVLLEILNLAATKTTKKP